MLKIKDNVHLKELEKFGFKDKCPQYYEKEFDADYYDEEEGHTIIVYKESKEIALDIMNNDYTYHSFADELGGIEETLYDLIKADLVETVEE